MPAQSRVSEDASSSAGDPAAPRPDPPPPLEGVTHGPGRQPDSDFLDSRLPGIELGRWGDRCRLGHAVGPRGRVDVVSVLERPWAGGHLSGVSVCVRRGDRGGARRVHWALAQHGGSLSPRRRLSRASPSTSGCCGRRHNCPGHSARLAPRRPGASAVPPAPAGRSAALNGVLSRPVRSPASSLMGTLRTHASCSPGCSCF